MDLFDSVEAGTRTKRSTGLPNFLVKKTVGRQSGARIQIYFVIIFDAHGGIERCNSFDILNNFLYLIINLLRQKDIAEKFGFAYFGI